MERETHTHNDCGVVRERERDLLLQTRSKRSAFLFAFLFFWSHLVSPPPSLTVTPPSNPPDLGKFGREREIPEAICEESRFLSGLVHTSVSKALQSAFLVRGSALFPSRCFQLFPSPSQCSRFRSLFFLTIFFVAPKCRVSDFAFVAFGSPWSWWFS